MKRTSRSKNWTRGTSFILLLLLVTSAAAEDWPQWRGPNRDGAWHERGIRETSPAGGLKIRWRTPVEPGLSSPVIVKGRVFLTDVKLEKPKAHERVLCFTETTGKLLWSKACEVTYPDWAFIPEHGTGPTATPIVEAGRLYVLGRSGQVYCLDARSGNSVWEHDLGKDYEVGELGCRSSPLIEGDLLILFIGGKPGACVVALDKRTGKEVWKALDEPVSNSSPLVITAGGRKQLIVWTDLSVTSLDPATGRTFWREPMTTSNNDAIASPVFHQDRLLIGGLMFKLDATRPEAVVLWPESRAVAKRVLSNTSTALFRDDYVYSAKSSGELVCLDAATGRQIWETNSVTGLKSGASIHLTPNGDAVLLYTDEGKLIRAQLTPQGYREFSRSPLLEPTTPLFTNKFAWAPPSFANGHVFARNDHELVCADLRAKP